MPQSNIIPLTNDQPQSLDKRNSTFVSFR